MREDSRQRRTNRQYLSQRLHRTGPFLIPGRFVDEAIATARRNGIGPEKLLRDASIDIRSGSPVRNEQFAYIWQRISEAIDDEYLGLGRQRMPLGSLKILSHYLVHARNFEEAMRRALDFMRIVIDRPRARLDTDGALAAVVFEDEHEDWPHFAYHMFWIILGGMVGWFVGRRVLLRGVDFHCPPPGAEADYRDLLRTPARFLQTCTRFSFDADYLALPVIRNEEDLADFLSQIPGILLHRFWDEQTLASAIRERLLGLPPMQWPTFQELANDMSVPGSTLRRRLRNEGYGYHIIKDGIRRSQAVHALLYSMCSVEQIGMDLGFAEPSAFHRAFRKWFSSTPAAFRRNHGDIDPGS